MSHPLLSKEVARALAELGASADSAEEGDPLRTAARLRRVLPPELARTAAELHDLRRRARNRLAGAERLLLTRKGLEQASDRRVAAARAERIARALSERSEARGARLWDATAGIGSDAHAAVEAGLTVVASDADPLTARLLTRNVPGAAVVCADACAPPFVGGAGGAFDVVLVDPDRRPTSRGEAGGGREGRSGAWSPPLPAALALAAGAWGACLKLPPAFDPDEVDLPPELADLPIGWQWVSLRGELREVALWTGGLAGERREVLALDRAGRGTRLSGERVEVEPLGAAEAADVTRVAWIAEPDPAVIRAGFVGRVATEAGARPLGPGLAYLGGTGTPPASRLLTTFRVLAGCALDRKRVRAMLRDHDVGTVTVKKRGHPEPAETLARRLRGPGRRRGVVLVARLERGHRAYLVERLPGPPA